MARSNSSAFSVHPSRFQILEQQHKNVAFHQAHNQGNRRAMGKGIDGLAGLIRYPIPWVVGEPIPRGCEPGGTWTNRQPRRADSCRPGGRFPPSSKRALFIPGRPAFIPKTVGVIISHFIRLVIKHAVDHGVFFGPSLYWIPPQRTPSINCSSFSTSSLTGSPNSFMEADTHPPDPPSSSNPAFPGKGYPAIQSGHGLDHRSSPRERGGRDRCVGEPVLGEQENGPCPPGAIRFPLDDIVTDGLHQAV